MRFKSLTIKHGENQVLEWFGDVVLVEEYKQTYIALQGGVEVARMNTYDDCPVHIVKDKLEIQGLLSEAQAACAGEEYGEWVLEQESFQYVSDVC